MIVFYNHYQYKKYSCSFFSTSFYLVAFTLSIELFLPIIILSYIDVVPLRTVYYGHNDCKISSLETKIKLSMIDTQLKSKIISWHKESPEEGILLIQPEKNMIVYPERNQGDILNGDIRIIFLYPLYSNFVVNGIRFSILLNCTLKSKSHKFIPVISRLNYQSTSRQTSHKNHISLLSLYYDQHDLFEERFTLKDYISNQLDDSYIFDFKKNISLNIDEKHLWISAKAGYFNSTTRLKFLPQGIDFQPSFLYKFKWYFVYYIFIWAILFFVLNRIKRSLFDKRLVQSKMEDNFEEK